MKTEPLDLRVLIKLDPTETKTAGGIYIPESVAERNKMSAVYGEIVAMGENAFNELKNKPSVGDRVMIARYAGTNVEKKSDADADLRVCNDEDVIAVIR